jgi:hypothetical protein
MRFDSAIRADVSQSICVVFLNGFAIKNLPYQEVLIIN